MEQEQVYRRLKLSEVQPLAKEGAVPSSSGLKLAHDELLLALCLLRPLRLLCLLRRLREHVLTVLSSQLGRKQPGGWSLHPLLWIGGCLLA